MIFLVRHGQTEMNLQGRMQGKSDAPLTSDGKEFARKTAGMLAEKIGVDETIIFTSPLGRAESTARIIADRLPSLKQIVTDDHLAEVDLGKWDGLTLEEIDNGWPGARDSVPSGEWFFTAPQGENFETFQNRNSTFLKDLSIEQTKHKIIVSHGISGRILRGLHAGLPKKETVTLRVPGNACFILLDDGGIEELVVD